MKLWNLNKNYIMKNHIFATYIFIFLTIFSYAQEEASFPCVNNVSTDYREDINGNPKANNEKLPLVGVSPDNRFLNGFNWVDGNTGFGSYSTNGMMFTQNQSYGNMLNLKLQTQPAIEFYNYLWTGPEFTPEEGWGVVACKFRKIP